MSEEKRMCANCKHFYKDPDETPCKECHCDRKIKNLSKWEPKD